MCLLRVSGAEQRRLQLSWRQGTDVATLFCILCRSTAKKKQEEAQEQEGKLSQEDWERREAKPASQTAAAAQRDESYLRGKTLTDCTANVSVSKYVCVCVEYLQVGSQYL